VIYTSGSTGRPKGVMIAHRAIPRLALNNRFAEFRPSDVVAFASNPAFDAATLEIWAPLLTGARLIVIPHSILLEPERFADTLERGGVTAMWLTVGLFNQYADALRDVFPQLRYLIVGGDVLDPRVIADVITKNPPQHLLNGYGPTETTTFATTHEIRSIGSRTQSIPIGRAIAKTLLYILDDRGEGVPIGVAGELHVGGTGVARGYLDRPDLTAERFVPDPFSDGEGVRLYRTGDLCRWLTDGTIEFLGRNDFQVKIRGFRIELEEIEARLHEYEGLRDAVVMTRNDAAGELSLVAYYTCRDEGTMIGAEALRRYLWARLPEYMTPAAYVRLSQLPLTENGKLDRKALPEPNSESYVAHGDEPPVGEVEKALAKAWMQVLKRDSISRRDNFFEIGGTSLRAVLAMKELEQAGIRLAAVHLFMHPTIESLARVIDAAAQSRYSDVPIRVKEGAGTPLFLAPSGIGQLIYVPALAPHIDNDAPVYGLPPVPRDEKLHRTVEGMAARMVRMIRATQPEGPYHIGGWSFGGILAYEIAAQLIGADQEVRFLGLFDTYYSGGGAFLHPEAQIQFDDRMGLLNVIEEALAGGQTVPLSADDLEVALQSLRASVKTMDLDAFTQRCRALSLMPERYNRLTALELAQTFNRERAHLMADYRYYAQTLPIPVHLFVAQASEKSCLDAWKAVVPPNLLRVIPLDGDHHTIMHSPRVEPFGRALAQSMRHAGERPNDIPERRYSPMAPLRTPRSAAAPLFCVPGAGATVSSFRELADCLDNGRGVYGFEPRGLEGCLVPHCTVEAAAESCLQEIERCYPKGPVHLLGHSFGGWVAFQIASMLSARGRTMALCAILDSEPPDSTDRLSREFDNTDVMLAWAEAWELVLGHPLGVNREEIDQRAAAIQREILHKRLIAEGLMPLRSDPELLAGPLRTYAASVRTHYKPAQPFTGPVRLVLVDDPRLDAARNEQKHRDAIGAWKYWAPELRCVRGPGNHLTMMKAPHVKTLATLLQDEYAVSAHR
jgi:thioesterase domain-containing protein